MIAGITGTHLLRQINFEGDQEIQKESDREYEGNTHSEWLQDTHTKEIVQPISHILPPPWRKSSLGLNS